MGYHCLCFDGPGQGAPLFHQGLHFRAEWENVVRAVVDYALTRGEVDPARIALVGISFGGYLAPRAASGEPRLAACIADPGQIGLLESFRARALLPEEVKAKLPHVERALLEPIFAEMQARPATAWLLNRGLLTHGVATPYGYLQVMAEFTLAGRIEQITCPTLICDAESDPIAVNAKALYDELPEPKHYLHFVEAEGAGRHCEVGARALFEQRVFDWLEPLCQLCRRQQMRWSTPGAHLLAQVRCAAINGDLVSRLRRWRAPAHDQAVPPMLLWA